MGCELAICFSDKYVSPNEIAKTLSIFFFVWFVWFVVQSSENRLRTAATR